MENHRTITYTLVTAACMIAGPALVLAYYEQTTHPALTQEIVRLYNHHFPNQKLTDEERQLVMEGSTDEDTGTRWLNHFYDPMKKRGLVLVESDPQYREVAGIGFAPHLEWKSSKEWALSPASQAGIRGVGAGILAPYFSSAEDFSWERAIYDYAWGDKKRGLIALGHILHLLEDASVPDHTRNDPHPPLLSWGSPYEIWTKEFNPANFTATINEAQKKLQGLSNHFDAVASYSNSKFFSEDTIQNSEYPSPKVVRFAKEKSASGNSRVYAYGRDEDNSEYRLAFVSAESRDWKGNQILSLDDPDGKVLPDYWSRLSKQAVLHGAGVVKLFFDEVEKEKQTKALFDKNRPLVAKALDRAKFGLRQLASVLEPLEEYALQPLESGDLAFSEFPEGIPTQPKAGIAIWSRVRPRTQVTRQAQIPAPPKDSGAPAAALADTGTAAAPAPRPGSGDASPQATDQTPQSQTANISSSLGGGGGSGGGGGGGSGNPTGGTINTPPEPSAPPADTSAPDITISVTQCSNSLSSDSCLVATTALTVNWSSTASDLDRYVVECLKGSTSCTGFNYSPTGTSANFTAEDSSSYTFRAKAIDRTGNESAFVSQSVEINLTPMVINEIAWAGTADASQSDEWIELYNRSSKSISLSGWVLRSATDEKPYINLSGTVASGGYYLIERDLENVTSVSSSLTSSFGADNGAGLIDTGEVLNLQNGSTTIDQTPALNSCGANVWCGGSSTGRKSMERVDPDLTGTDTASWGTNDGILRNGTAAGGSALNATSKARNSRNYYISQNNALASNKTLTSSKSPYFIDTSDLTVNAGVTLSIDPGVVIKFQDSTSDLIVNGTLKALGSSASNIVFTSFADDSYGGDMNGDGSATSPAAGDWRSITFNSQSQSSELSYTRVRYGGKWFSGQTAGHALLKADNSSITVSNSTLERSLQYGLWLINSTSTISGSTVRNNAVDSISYGIYLDGGASTVQSSTLASNTIGIRAENSASPTISGNTFSSNTNEAISIVGSTPSLSSNSASSNGVNGVIITGTIGSNYTFASNLPYVVDGTLTLISGKTFGTTAGTVFKGRTSSATIEAQGVFNITGSSASPVVFTSLKDDDHGGDTNADGLSTSPAVGDWRAVSFSLTATSSSVSQAVVRYGGDATLGAMSIDSVGVDVSNSTFEFNKFKGLRLNNATSTLSNLTVRNHTSGGGEPTGLYIDSGSRAVVSNTTLSANTIGIISTGGSTVSNGGGNSFSGNTINSVPTGLLQ